MPQWVPVLRIVLLIASTVISVLNDVLNGQTIRIGDREPQDGTSSEGTGTGMGVRLPETPSPDGKSEQGKTAKKPA